jgi:hypothetical protein
MTILSNQPVATDWTHPEWCSIEHCEANSPLGRHSSRPYPTRTSEDDVEVRVAVVRNDQLDVDGTPLGARFAVRLDVEHLLSVCHCGRDVLSDAHLTPDEAEQLSLALAYFAERARGYEQEVAR